MMKGLLFLLLFIKLLICEDLLRLSTKQNYIFSINDTIYSTLGTFRMSLINLTCSIKVQKFNSRQYILEGLFPNTPTGNSCQYMILGQGLLQTPNGINLIKIESSDNSLIKQTTLTIDDMGIIRVIGFLEMRSANILGYEERVTEFRYPQKYIYTTSDITISEMDSLSFRVNKGGWGFSASQGQLKIFMINDPSKVVRYQYDNFKITLGQFYDKNNIAPPYANIQGLKYLPRCGFIKNLDFQAPFVFQIDDFWPQLRVLDQGGYQLLAIRYPSYQCINDLGYHSLIGTSECIDWFCPPQTFQYQGQCLARCPNQYYHQIKQNNKNKCVLVCEQGSIVTKQFGMKICTCGSKWQPPKCNTNLSEITAKGCTCTKQGMYSYKQIGCLQQCPLGYYNHDDGICIKCPLNCASCVKSVLKINYLLCLQCYQQYELFGGICKKTCRQNYCEKCEQQFCRQCQGNICTKCEKPYIIFNNTCIRNFVVNIDNCPIGYSLQMIKQDETYKAIQAVSYFTCKKISLCSEVAIHQQKQHICKTCQLIDQVCWKDCKDNNFYINQSRCFCQRDLYNANLPFFSITNYGFVENCLPQDQRKTLCPYKFYLYEKTQECLPCPIGCLSCQQDVDGLIECTSCAPSYFLILNIDWGHICQRDTSIASCLQDDEAKYYDSENKICDFNDSSSYRKQIARTLCKQDKQNCLMCLFKSKNVCTFCQKNYFLYQGQCIKNCPKGTLSYHRVCLIFQEQQIQTPDYLSNCRLPKIIDFNHLIKVDTTSQGSQGYNYLLAKSQLLGEIGQRIDPIGKLYLFFGKIISRSGYRSREGAFDQGIMICEQCQSGHGLNLLTHICQPCQQFPICLKCSDPTLSSCTQCHQDYYLQGKECRQKSEKKKLCKQNEYRLQNYTCSAQCKGFYNQWYDELINCTSSCPNVIKKQKDNSLLICTKQKQDIFEQTKIYTASTVFRLTGGQHIYFMTLLNFENKIQTNFDLQNTKFSIFECLYKHAGSVSSCMNLKQSIMQASTNIRRLQQKTYSNFIMQNNKILITFNQQNFPDQYLSFGIDPNLLTPNTPFLSNSRYYFTSQSPSYDSLLNTGLAVYGKIYVFIFFTLAVLFMYDELDYKLDNVFILLQTLPLFLFSLNLTQIYTKDTYRFLYGFKWSIGHLFGAPQSISLINENNLPYIQNSPNNAHHLINIDNNILRNSYVSLIILAIVGLVFLVLGLVMKYIINKYNNQGDTYQPKDIDHRPKLIKFYLFLIQLTMFPIFYYSISNLMNRRWQASSGTFGTISIVLSIIFIFSIVIYTCVRFYIHRIGGIYMLKRLGLSIVLAFVQGSSLVMLFAVIIQIIFALARLYYQVYIFTSSNKQFKRRLLFLLVQQICILISYLMLTSLDFGDYKMHGSMVLIIWAIINIFLVMMGSELIENFFKNIRKQQQYQILEKQKQKYITKINKIWYSIQQNTTEDSEECLNKQ